MKINATKMAVGLFILVLIIAANYARADNGARISLGKMVANSHMTSGELSYEHNGIEAAALLMGAGNTKKGYQPETWVYSVSHIVRPQWCVMGGCNYYRLGVSYNDSSVLVGDTNFRLGIGIEWDVVQLEYFHHSSAGIHDPNTGLDGIQLRFKVPF